MPAQFDRLAVRSQLKVHVRVLVQELLRDANHRRMGRRNAEIAQEYGRDPFVHQDPPVLRIVEKLDHVAVAVGRLDQVRLRSAAHLADQAARINRHGAASCLSLSCRSGARLGSNAVPLEII